MDEEIAVLERRLGIKRGERLPVEFADEGLEDLLGDLAGSDQGESSDGASSEGSESEGEFDGFESDDGKRKTGDEAEGPPRKKRRRENPYLPAVDPKAPAEQTRYLPPALRNLQNGDGKNDEQIRRRLQGLINRLTESNLLTILGELTTVLSTTARSTSIAIVVELLVTIVREHNGTGDTFLVLQAAFSSALYRRYGLNLGAVLLKQIVDDLDGLQGSPELAGSSKKHALNLLTFLAHLYSFRVVASTMIFGVIRPMLSSLTESNTEMLLTILRGCGVMLRQEDPTVLKEIVVQVQALVSEEYADKEIPARTGFMLDTMTALKNNKGKLGAGASSQGVELTVRLKRLMGGMGDAAAAASRPMQFDLETVKKGDPEKKWWLLPSSASVAHLQAQDQEQKPGRLSQPGDKTPSIALEALISPLVAKQPTPLRRRIAASLQQSTDYLDALSRLSSLHLTKKQSHEIPRVVLSCLEAESTYNPFYAFLASELCAQKEARHAFKIALFGFFERWGAEEDGEQEVEGVSAVTVVGMGRFYAFLGVRREMLGECLQGIQWSGLDEFTRLFLQVLLAEVLVSKGMKRQGDVDVGIEKTFRPLRNHEEMRKGVSRFLRKEMAGMEAVVGAKRAGRVRARGLEVREYLLSLR